MTRAWSGARVDQPADVGELVRVVDRAVEDVLVGGVVAGLDVRFDRLGQRRDEVVVDALLHDDAGGGGAVLAAVEEPGRRDALDRRSMSASSKTTTGALPPSSRWARLRSAAAAVATAMPARVEPVMETSCGIGCSVSAAPVSRSPQTRLQTPGGKISCIFSTIQYDDAGVVSEGLSTTVLPAASAGANFQTDIIIG